MRILYLCKRQYMGHDVIVDRYARLYEQPYQLAQLGHDVLGLCLSYRNCQVKNETHETRQGSLRWIGLSAGEAFVNIFLYPYQTLKLTRAFKPDIIVGASDCMHVILGQWLAKKINAKYAADLYDDYETFGLAKIPFIKMLYRKALYKAQVISSVSQSLSAYIKDNYSNKADVITLPSTINQSIFYPRDKNVSRNKFNLPPSIPIIGTAGGLTKEKGIETVYKAFTLLTQKIPNAHFILAGSTDPKCIPPKHDRIHYLGKLSHTEVADFFCALDVGVVYLNNSKYCELSFPQKAYEIAACKIPMVVTKVGDMSFLFSENKNELYNANDAEGLCDSIYNQILTPSIPNIHIETWDMQAKKMEYAYLTALQRPISD